MKEQKQKVFDKKVGDCMRACIASILEIENNDDFIKIKKGNWLKPYMERLSGWGLRLNWDKDKIWREGYWIGNVPSLNFKDTLHAIVMKGSKVAFDPSTHKKYKTGFDMLGKDLISFGYWIEVSNFSKLKKFLKK